MPWIPFARGLRGLSLLITRFIANEAEFLFVSVGQLEEVAEERNAIPFDAAGVELGHGPHGSCSSESTILKSGLKEPGVLRLAKIVPAANVANEVDKDPIARGLEVIASRYSPRFPDDGENLEHQFEVYDALHAWCRLDAARGAGCRLPWQAALIRPWTIQRLSPCMSDSQRQPSGRRADRTQGGLW